MTNLKFTKRALLMSVATLVVCFAMLVGTTFAWFTSSVTSNENIIQTGTLKIGMYWANGEDAVPTAAEGWTNAGSGAIFNNDKWEPGYVEAKHLKIANEGTLALKYKLLIVPNGTVEDLADVIDVYFIEGATQLTREMLANATPVGTLRDMIDDKDGAAHGALLPAGETATNDYERVGEVTATLAFKMREDAGNEYQDMSIGTNFSIQLLATQYTFEEDSFDNKYDTDAEYAVADGVYIQEDGSLLAISPEALSNVSGLATEDKTITSVNYQTEAGVVEVPVVRDTAALKNAAKEKTPIVVLTEGSYSVPATSAGQEITIVGNEKTEIDISKLEYPSGNSVSTINFTGVTINGNGYTNGMAYTKATFTNCIFNTVNTYLYNDTTFIGCEFNVNGDYYALWTWGAGTVEFIDCDFNTQGKALYVNANLTSHKNGNNYQDVIITDCRFNDNGDDTITNKAAIETGDDYNCHVYNITITNTEVNGFAVTEDKTSSISYNYGGTDFGTYVWGNKYLMNKDMLNVVIDGVDVH